MLCLSNLKLRKTLNRRSTIFIRNRLITLYVKTGEAWEMPKLQKELLGQRSLIVTTNDMYSKQMSQRMWFEMQKNNIEGVFCTMDTQYPIERNIKESIDLFRRTGADSIVSIGSGNVSDFTKLMRDLLEIGFKKSENILNYQNLKMKRKESIPLCTIACSYSNIHFTNFIGYLHPEDDVLIRFDNSKPPEVLIFDYDVISSSPYFINEVNISYGIASLFDILFSLSFLSICSNNNNNISNDMLSQNILKYLNNQNDNDGLPNKIINEDSSLIFNINDLKTDFTNLLANSDYNNNNQPANYEALSRISYQLGLLKSKTELLSLENFQSPWVGVLELSSLLSAVDYNDSRSYPYSWIFVNSFYNLVQLYQSTESEIDEDDKEEYNIMQSVKLSLLLLEAITGQSLSNISNNLERNLSLIKQKHNNSKKLFSKKANDSYLATSNMIEKLIILEEMDQDKKQNQGDNNILRSNKNSSNNKIDNSYLKLLKSDLFLDLVNKNRYFK